MPFVLESRHRLLHLRASLETKWSQSRAPFNVHWIFSQFKIMSLRRDDLMAIDVGKLKNKETIMLPKIWERDASRGVFRGFTIASWKILNFVNLNSDMIELKKSVSRWTNLRRKISPIIRKNWWISLNNSGKTGPVRDRSDFNDALTTLNRLHHESGEQQLSNGTNHRVLPPVGGNGAILGGVHNNSKNVDKWGCMQSDLIQRGNPLFAVFGYNLRRATFNFWFCCRWICQDKHLTSPFSQCESLQGIPAQVRKWISLAHWQQLNWWHEIQNDKSNNMCIELKLVETHEYIQWLVNAVDWTTAELVCFCRVPSLLSVSASLDCFSLFRCTHTALAQGSRAYRSSGSH